MMNVLLILFIIVLTCGAVFLILREDIKSELRNALISFVVLVAVLISAPIVWKAIPKQKTGSNPAMSASAVDTRSQQALHSDHLGPPFPSFSGAQDAYTQAPYTGSEAQRDAPSSGEQHGQRTSRSSLVQSILPSVVLIKTSNGGVGSGFFINRDGALITNHHVLCNNHSANIHMSNGRVYRITHVLAEDASRDLIMVHADVPPYEITPLNLSASPPAVGESVLVVGSPLGLQNTVSDGIVSAVRELASIRFIQTTAPISPGNSGGPLVNRQGDVVGVATWQVQGGQNLNFCISSEYAAAMRPTGSYFLSQVQACRGPFRPQQKKRDIYCYLDQNGSVKFVDWATDALITRSDGSLDRVRYENWVLEKIGGDPSAIDPVRAAQEYIDENYDRIFRQTFPYKGYYERSVTNEEQAFLYNKINMIRSNVHNRAAAQKNEMIRRYKYMMYAYDVFARQYE